MNNHADLVWGIVHAGHRIEERLDSALQSCGLSLAKLNALRHLVEAGEPLALGQLAERIACVKSNVTQLVDRLENEGLVKRLPDPNDRRSVLAGVTEEGERRYRMGATALKDAEQSILEEFPIQYRELLSDLIGQAGIAGA